MPSAASWLLSRRQKAHHVVVYIVSGCGTLTLPLRKASLLNCTNAGGPCALPASERGERHRHAEVCRRAEARRDGGPAVIGTERESSADAGSARPGGEPGPAVSPGPALAPEAAAGSVLSGPEAFSPAWTPSSARSRLAPRGPVCVLAGAGRARPARSRTGSLIWPPRRRQTPSRVLAVTFTTQCRGRAARPSPPARPGSFPDADLGKVQARTFHSAALRQLTHFWPSTVGGPAPAGAGIQDQPRRRGGPPPPDLGRPARAARRRGRDRVGEGHPGPAGRLCRRERQGGPDAAARRGRGGADLRRLRGAADRASPRRLRVRARAHGRDPGGVPGRRALGSRPVRLLRRRRVPGRQPAAEAPARHVARRPGRDLRGGRPAPDDLLVHRCHARVPDRVPGRVPGRAGDQARPQLPVDSAGGDAGEQAGDRGRDRRARSARGPAAGRPCAAADRVPR